MRSSLLRRVLVPLFAVFPAVLPIPAFADEEPARVSGVAMDGRILYEVLLAEIAAARGYLDVALELQLDLARRSGDVRLAQRATEIAIFARDMEATLEGARLWLDADPSSEDAQRIVAGMLSQQDQGMVHTRTELARLLALSEERLEQNLLGLVRAFSRVPDKQEVYEHVLWLTSPYVDLPEAHIARAQAAYGAQEPDAALEAAREALRLRPDWDQAVMIQAELLRESDPAASVDLLEDYLTRHAGEREIRLALARGLVAAERYPEAREVFAAMLAEDPQDLDLGYAVAALALELQDFEMAIEHFERLLEQGHPQVDTIRVYLGQAHQSLGQIDAAAQWYGSVTEGNHVLQARGRLASLLAGAGRLEEARAALHELDLDSVSAGRLSLIEVQLLRDAGQEVEALDLLKSLLAEDDTNAELLYEAGMLAERLDRVDLMEQYLRRLIELYPEHAHAYNALGYSLADRGLRLEEAIELIEQALELAPDDAFIIDSMGWVLFRSGQVEAALEHLERAHALRPDPEIAAHLGEVYWALGRREEARQVWETARREHPENRTLTETVERLLR